MDNLCGSMSTRKTEVSSFPTFLRIHIRVISAWFLGVANTQIQLALGSPWMEEISSVFVWVKERQCVGSHTANIQERQWHVS